MSRSEVDEWGRVVRCSKILLIYYSIVKWAWLGSQRHFIHPRGTPPSRADAAARVYVRRRLPFPGGEDGGSWSRGVFQRREPCLVHHLSGAAPARRGRRFWLPFQDADFEYPFVVSACHWVIGIHSCKRGLVWAKAKDISSPAKTVHSPLASGFSACWVRCCAFEPPIGYCVSIVPLVQTNTHLHSHDMDFRWVDLTIVVFQMIVIIVMIVLLGPRVHLEEHLEVSGIFNMRVNMRVSVLNINILSSYW